MQRGIASLILLGLAACADMRAAAGRPGSPPHFAQVPDQVLVTPGATIRFRDYSDGSAVILLHGYTDRLETMEGLADSLADSHRIIALDARGFGGSTKYSDPARYGAAMLDDVLLLMDNRGVGRAHVIGYSMGALMAANLAARHPDRVLSVTLLGVPYFGDSATARAFFSPYAEAMRNGDDGFRDFLDWMFPAWSDSALVAIADSVTAANDQGAMIAAFEGLVDLTIDRRTTPPALPVLSLVGSEDPLRLNVEAFAQWWQGSRLLVVPGADHETVLTHPTYIDAVREHLGSPRRTRPERFVVEGRQDAAPHS